MDLRVNRTKKSISDAYVELRSKKPLEKITIKELADLAFINKATFYQHYKDIYDWRDRMEEEYQAKINSIHDRINDAGFEGSLALFLHLIQDELDILTALLFRSGEASSIKLIHEVFYHRDGHLEENAADDAERTYLKKLRYYHIYGCCGLIVSWVSNGMRESPEEMAHEISIFTENDRS